MKTSAYIISLISVVSLLASCLSEEGFGTSSNTSITSSVDTLSLDTVIAGVPTNTYTFQVYNPSSENLRITRIALQSGNKSSFRVNVDGTFLQETNRNSWELYSKDSLRVFVELTAPETSYDNPQTIEDKISFYLENGNTLNVVLKAVGQRVERLSSTILAKDSIFNSSVPYLIKDSLIIPDGKTLTLSPGTRLLFHPKAQLIVYGTLIAKGTAKQNIILRGDRMGYMFSQQPYDRIPGQWGGIVFKKQSFHNILDFCDIHSSDFGIRCDSSGVSTRKLVLSNSIVHNVSTNALTFNQCKTEIGNTQITNAGGNCVNIIGGDNLFIHCTIGQFYSLVGGRGIALNISHTIDQQLLPISRAYFKNCIITGYNEDDINIESSTQNNQEINYLFDHCILNTPSTSDQQRIIECIFENDLPSKERRELHFDPAFDFHKLLFPFTLPFNSPLQGKANIELTRQTFPLDRLGRIRIINETSAPGCYAGITTKLK